ncbi:MAG: helix-turn-helix domain-containing protein [Candidatus Velthaea sp.]|jgi:DNA-binding HxlR family transcriptional regulator
MLPRGRSKRDDPDSDEIKCPIRQILGRIGGRWTLDIIMALGNGPCHFAEIDRRIPGISRRMLTLTLRGLERDGLISRRADGRVGSMIHYGLTEVGRGLDVQLHALTEWSRAQREAIYAARDRYDREHTAVEPV